MKRNLFPVAQALVIFPTIATQCLKPKPSRRAAAKLPSKDQARQIAANIAKLPELLGRKDQTTCAFCFPLRQGRWRKAEGL
jgi:hypothetical protein